jgi:hypothetical protein
LRRLSDSLLSLDSASVERFLDSLAFKIGDIGGSADTGGTNTGGADTGGTNTGSADTGGTNTGGADTGGIIVATKRSKSDRACSSEILMCTDFE